MKFTFAAACLLGVTLAKRKFVLADDSGFNHENIATADVRDHEFSFKSDSGVEDPKRKRVDNVFGEGWEILNSGFINFDVSKNDLYDETIFEGSNGVVINVNGVSGYPFINNYWYYVSLTVSCADGNYIFRQRWETPHTYEPANFRLEADTTFCDITNIRVIID